MPITKLTNDQIEELRAALKKPGARAVDLAKKFGLTPAGITYHRRRVMGKVRAVRSRARSANSGQAVVINSPAQANAAMKADILAGMRVEDVAEKYGVGKSSVWDRKRTLKKEAAPTFAMTVEQRAKAVEMLARVNERRPEVFVDVIGFMAKKYPTLWLEVL